MIPVHPTSLWKYLDKNLQANQKEVTDLIKLHNPKIIIIFHPVGIRSLLLDSKELLQFLSSDNILIEDAVHQLINPQKIEIKRKNHFILTSLRKVVPLQGSILFGRKEDVQKLKGSMYIDFSYIMRVLIYWGLMQLFLSFQKYTALIPIKKFSGKYAEKFMLKGYDVIGDSPFPAWCPSIFSRTYFHINFEKVKNIKKEQVKMYKKELKHYHIFFPEKDEEELRGFPIILNKKYADEFISKIRNEGICLRKELPDCLWAKKYSIAYLPLGPYLDKCDIGYIISKVNNIIECR